MIQPDGMLSRPVCRISLPIGEPRNRADWRSSADQGKNYVLIVGKENRVGIVRLSWDKWSMDSRVVTQEYCREKIILKGLVRPGMTVAPRLVPMRQNVTDKQTRDID